MPSITFGLDRVIKEYFNLYREKGEMPPLLKERLPGRLMRKLPYELNYFDKDIKAGLMGRLDECVVEEVRGKSIYYPVDHKSRASSPSKENYSEKYYQLQMDIYALLLEEFLREVPGAEIGDRAFLIYYYPQEITPENLFQFAVEIQTVEVNVRRAREKFHQAVRFLREGKLPKEHSKNCPFGEWERGVRRVERKKEEWSGYLF